MWPYTECQNGSRTKCERNEAQDQGPLWPRHAAPRIVGPVPVEPDDAPLHAPTGADPAGVLTDPVVDGAGTRVGHQRHAAAKAARDAVRRAARPWPERGLVNTVESDDLQIGLPELALLLGEPRHDLAEHGRMLALRHHGVVARAGQPEVQFQQTGGSGGRRPCAGDRGRQGKSQSDEPDHVAPPAILLRRSLRSNVPVPPYGTAGTSIGRTGTVPFERKAVKTEAR